MNGIYDDIFAEVLVKKETPKQETPKQEVPKQETPIQAKPTQDTPKVEIPKVETPKEETPKQEKIEVVEEKKNEVEVHKTKNGLPITTVSKLLSRVVDYARTSNEDLDSKTKTLCVDIIAATNKKVIEEKLSWADIDINGSALLSQIKRYGKLGLNAVSDKLYIDIRFNSKTDKRNIIIRPQYQTIEKLMRKYCARQIIRFKEDVICVGDKLVVKENFVTGLDEIHEHIRNEDIDRNDIDNIIGAYKIAYVQEDDKLVQYVVRIDKNRINRARNASASKEKNVWKNDTRKMVLKTVTWEMWNNSNIRAFMIFPEEIVNDLSVIEETSEMDFNKETAFKNVEKQQENVDENVATGEVIEVTYED